MKHQGQRLTLKTAENNKQQETTKGIHRREIVFLIKEYYYFGSLHIRVIHCISALRLVLLSLFAVLYIFICSQKFLLYQSLKEKLHLQKLPKSFIDCIAIIVFRIKPNEIGIMVLMTKLVLFLSSYLTQIQIHRSPIKRKNNKSFNKNENKFY
jgi:hypothetical protein